jgi:hypothetical protein
MPDDECHLFGRTQGRGNDKVTLTLAIIIVGDDDDRAFGESAQCRVD